MVVTTSHCWSATYLTKNRDSEASTNKEPLLIHDALVGIDHRAQTAVLAHEVRVPVGKGLLEIRSNGFSQRGLSVLANGFGRPKLSNT